MSLARSLTSRMRERFEQASTNSALPPPSRAYSTKVATAANPASKAIDRRLISLPTALLSTSNSLAYEAPDIKNPGESKTPTSPRSPHHAPSQPLMPLVAKQQQPQQSPTLTVSSSHSSLRSWEDGLASPHSPALTSASSVTSNEFSREPSPSLCEPNPMSKTFLLDRDQPETPALVVEEKPAVPQRSSLHTKQSHTMLARARSQSRQPSPRESADNKMEPPTLAENRASTKSAMSVDSKHISSGAPKLPPVNRTSTDFFSSSKKSLMDESPFSAELAQVTELVEKYNTNENGEPTIIDEETQYLIDNGFRCFGATDYILEIQPLFHRAFGESGLPVIAEWI